MQQVEPKLNGISENSYPVGILFFDFNPAYCYFYHWDSAAFAQQNHFCIKKEPVLSHVISQEGSNFMTHGFEAALMIVNSIMKN